MAEAHREIIAPCIRYACHVTRRRRRSAELSVSSARTSTAGGISVRGASALTHDRSVGMLAAIMLAWGAGDRANKLYSPGSIAVDFYQFWTVGKAAREFDVGNVYTAAQRRRLGEAGVQAATAQAPQSAWAEIAVTRPTIEVTSTPFLFAPFSFLPRDYDAAWLAYNVASLLAVIFAGLACAWLAGLSLPAAALSLTVLLWLFEPTASDVRVGNVGQLQLGLLAAALLCLHRRSVRREVAGGVLLAALVLLKPNAFLVPVALVLVRLAGRRFRDAAALAAGGAAGTLLGVAIGAWRFGRLSIWADWLASLQDLARMDRSLELGNYSLSRLFQETLALHLPAVIIFAACATAVAVVVFRNRDASDVLAAGAAMAATLLSSRLAWLHYFLLLAPALIVLGSSTSAVLRWTSCAAIVLFGVHPVARVANHFTPAIAAAQVQLGAALVFAACLRSLWRGGVHSPPEMSRVREARAVTVPDCPPRSILPASRKTACEPLSHDPNRSPVWQRCLPARRGRR